MLEITSAQRAKLRGMAMKLQPTAQLGKNGITDAFLDIIEDQLDSRELVKITVLRTVDVQPRQVVDELADILNAAPVQAVGFKIVLYRPSKREGVKHISI